MPGHKKSPGDFSPGLQLDKLKFESVVCHGEWTAFSYALIVLSGVVTDDVWLFHLNIEVLFNKIDGSEDR